MPCSNADLYTSTVTGPPVPPGLGKPTTHSRNLRRRRKKMYERLALTAEPSSVNEIPLGVRAHTLEPTATTPSVPSQETESRQPPKGKGKGKERARDGEAEAEAPVFMMASLSNKNKRRGFKDALTRGIPPKINFADTEAVLSASSSGQGSARVAQGDVDVDALVVEASLRVQETPQRTRQQQPRLVPPSEKQELGVLPPNMFVTSVDVEEGKWSSKRKNKNKNKKKKVPVEEAWDREMDETFEEGLPYDDESAQTFSAIQAGPANGVATVATTAGHGEAVEHAVIAARWNSLRKIADKSQVAVGTVVAWKVSFLMSGWWRFLAHVVPCRHWASTWRHSLPRCSYTSHALFSVVTSSLWSRRSRPVLEKHRSEVSLMMKRTGERRRPSSGQTSYRAIGGS